MGYSSSGGTKGLGTFNNTPQTVADLNQLVTLIARVGNIRVETETNRDAITGTALYEGLHVYNTTADQLEVYDGTGWVIPGDSGPVAISTFGSNWIATAGYEPKVRRVGRMVVLTGAVTIQSGGSLDSILTIPAGYRPPANTFVGHFRTQTGSAQGQLHLTSAGVLQSPSAYRTGSMSAGHVLPLTGTWFID